MRGHRPLALAVCLSILLAHSLGLPLAHPLEPLLAEPLGHPLACPREPMTEREPARFLVDRERDTRATSFADRERDVRSASLADHDPSPPTSAARSTGESPPGASAPPGRIGRPFRITLLGTGNPRPSLDRFGPSTLIEAGDARVLVDAGRGAAERLFQIDGGPLFRGVDTVLLTHLHSDHVVGLPDLWLTGWLFGRARSLEVIGPKGTRTMAAHLRKAFAFDVKVRGEDEGLPSEGARIEARDIAPGIALQRDGLKITAFAVDHGPVRPALGYRIDFDGRSVVLSGDTRASEAVVEQARGVDVLVHEVASPEVERRRAAMIDPKAIERVLARHASPEECGRIFARARPRLAVYSHIVPSPTTAEDLIAPTRLSYDGPLEVGHDLMTITIGERIEVTTRPGAER